MPYHAAMDTQPAPAAPSNAPEYAVSELAGAIKRTLEGAFGRVRVRGEITECKRYPSGHVYLSLKDESAKIEAVVWKFAVPRLGLAPENGLEVIATGKVGTYADRSKYQLVIERLEYAGAGTLLARIERLRVTLLEEGLFDAARKRPLPFLPAVIGVVTSERGAVLQDIRTTVLRRFPRRILLWPVAVQGAGAAEGVAAAIAGFSSLPAGGAVPRPDVVIVARGGGALEDLMAFNEEVVVRAAAASTIPLISAVGHETDTTLIDFASDRRAPTPTAAAELAVPVRAELLADLGQRGSRLLRGMAARLDGARHRLVRAERGLPDLPNALAATRQRLEDRAWRLFQAPRGYLAERQRRLDRVAGALRHPREVMATQRAALHMLEARGRTALGRLLAERTRQLDRAAAALPHPRQAMAAQRAAVQLLLLRGRAAARRRLDAVGRDLLRVPDPAPPFERRLRESRIALRGLGARLEAVSYQAVLARGFVLVQDADGTALASAAAVPSGTSLRLVFHDGVVGATADGPAPASAPDGPVRRPAPPRKAAPRATDQGALL